MSKDDKKQTHAQAFGATQTYGQGDNQLLMKSATESTATWVRGVRFSTHVVHTVMESIKMPTVVSLVKLILEANVCRDNSVIIPRFLSSAAATISRKSCHWQHVLFCSSICWRLCVVQVAVKVFSVAYTRVPFWKYTLLNCGLSFNGFCTTLNTFYPLHSYCKE